MMMYSRVSTLKTFECSIWKLQLMISVLNLTQFLPIFKTWPLSKKADSVWSTLKQMQNFHPSTWILKICLSKLHQHNCRDGLLLSLIIGMNLMNSLKKLKSIHTSKKVFYHQKIYCFLPGNSKALISRLHSAATSKEPSTSFVEEISRSLSPITHTLGATSVSQDYPILKNHFLTLW